MEHFIVARASNEIMVPKSGPGRLKLLPASNLRSRIMLLEEAVTACRAELQRRPSHCHELPPPQPADSSSSCMLLQLGHDEMGVVAHELCDPVQPLLAVNLGSTAKGLRVPMQAALAQLRQQRQEVEAFVALTGRATIAQLRNATSLELGSLHDKPLTLAHWRALGTLIGCGALPMLQMLNVNCDGDDCGEGVHMLAAGLHQGGLPSLQMLDLASSQIGDQAASALAAALTKRALPSIQILKLFDNEIGDVGLVALAPALRQLPKLREIRMYNNLIGDRGLAALIVQPMKGVLEFLEVLDLSDQHVTDASCVALASVLRSNVPWCEALPSFRGVDLREDSDGDFSPAHLELFESRRGLESV